MAAGFVAADARWQYIARHCWLRRILAGYLDCLPEQVPLVQGPHGKPNVAGRNDLQFNLTHSGAHTVLAIARSRSVAALGVDLEPVRAHEWASELVAAMFHERERHHWQRLPSTKPELRTRAFAVWWTAKEAWLKALGVGLLVGLDPFDATELAWAPNDRWLPVSITNEGDPHAAAAIRWHVRLFTPFRGYLGTLACGMTVSEVAPEGDTCDRTSSARVVEFVGRRCAVSLCATGTAGAESGETPANPGSSRPTLPCAGRCRAHGSTSFPVHPSGLAMGGQQSRSMARTPAVPSPSADLVAVA
jgi:4'-phosphopantetheinyl transferase